jgi:YVTN family beta-propeller protein
MRKILISLAIGLVLLIPVHAQRISGSIPLTAKPYNIVITPNGQKAYVTHTDSNFVSVVDIGGKVPQLLTTIDVGKEPRGLALTQPDGALLYVVNSGDRTVSVIDTAADEVVDLIEEVGEKPIEIAIARGKAYVPDALSNPPGMKVIDIASNRVERTIDFNTGKYPLGIAVKPDGMRAYVTAFLSRLIYVVDLVNNTLLTTVEVGQGPTSIAVTPDGTRALITNRLSNNVSILNTTNNQREGETGVGRLPGALAITPGASAQAYVVNTGENTVSVFEALTNNFKATIAVNSRPFGIAAHGARVYVTNHGTNDITIIDTETRIERNIIVQNRPYAMVIKSDGSKIYVSNSDSNSVSVINTSTGQTRHIENVGERDARPTGLAFTPGENELYVTLSNANAVRRINTVTDTIIEPLIPVGLEPTFIVISPQGIAYIGGPRSGNITVYDTNTRMGRPTISPGGVPTSLALSPDGKLLYVGQNSDPPIRVFDAAPPNLQITFIPQPGGPQIILITPDGTLAYVASGNVITVLDLTTDSPLAAYQLPSEIRGLARSPDGSQIYAGVDAGISVMNTATGFVPITFATDASSVRGLVFLPDGSKVYAGNIGRNTVSVIQVIR